MALRAASPSTTGHGTVQRSVRQICERERINHRIITFSQEMDKILGGGVALGQVTEFAGVPGVGKTQLGIQLAINVQLPAAFSGIAGEAIYIDTEGSFTPERCDQMAKSFCIHLQKLAQAKGDTDKLAAAAAVSSDTILGRIHVYRVRNHIEQLAAVELIPSILRRHANVRLIIVDSVAFHFRQDFPDMGLRTRILAQMAQNMMQLAGEKELAVVYMNQVTTKVGAGDDRGKLVPALGDSWTHAATTRVMLYWREKTRCAYVYKSPTQRGAAAEYCITASGIRSVSQIKGVVPQKRGYNP